jgi:radical SAM superfamily enzyme YgiQ (UPF0313 family)
MQPLCFAILKSLTPPGVETVLHDERLDDVPLDEPTDLVAMTVETYTARRAYQLATEYRRRGVPVVMGGYHPTFLPEESLRFADAVVQGDAEGLWPEVVADARRGRLRRLYRHDGAPPPLAGPPPDRSIFAGKRYVPVTLVQYGRGCKFNCDFCSIRAFYGSSLRQRPVREVCEEIERTGARLVFFVDDNIFVDVARARELFEALIPLKIRWFTQCSLDIAKDPSLVRLMQRSGCTSAAFGFESLDPGNLRQMRKGWNLKFQDYETAIRIIRDAGIMIYGTFVLGYDHDTTASFDRTVDFAIRHRFYLANFNPLTPTPGTPLHDRLANEGRLIFPRWWIDPRYRYGQAAFHPRGMTADELTAGCYRARSEFNAWRSFFRRLLERTTLRSPQRVGQYLLSNLIARREIHAKQGRMLGSAGPLDLDGDGGALAWSRESASGARDGTIAPPERIVEPV